MGLCGKYKKLREANGRVYARLGVSSRRKGFQMKHLLLIVGVGLLPIFVGATTPSFWGDGSPVTNRVPPVARMVSLPLFSSSSFFLRDFVLTPFDSTRLGLFMIFH